MNIADSKDVKTRTCDEMTRTALFTLIVSLVTSIMPVAVGGKTKDGHILAQSS